MGIAAPSVAEASSRLPSSVKAGQASADDVLVTSVASFPPAVDEPVSPELVLVDPELRERLRALLPEIELELPPPLLRAVPDPEPDDLLPLGPAARAGAGSSAHAAVAPPVRACPDLRLPDTRGALPLIRRRRSRSGRPRRRSSPSESSRSSVKARPLRRMPAPLRRTSPRRFRLLRPEGRFGQGDDQTERQAPGVTAARRCDGRSRATGASRTKTQRKAATGKAKAASQKAAAKRQKRTPPAAAAAEPKRFAWAPVERRGRVPLRAVPRRQAGARSADEDSGLRARAPMAPRRPHRDPHEGRLPLVRLAGAPERPSKRGGRAGAPHRSVALLLTRAGESRLESKSVPADDRFSVNVRCIGRPRHRTDQPGACARRPRAGATPALSHARKASASSSAPPDPEAQRDHGARNRRHDRASGAVARLALTHSQTAGSPCRRRVDVR